VGGVAPLSIASIVTDDVNVPSDVTNSKSYVDCPKSK